LRIGRDTHDGLVILENVKEHLPPRCGSNPKQDASGG
jgi:hypothetical protein